MGCPSWRRSRLAVVRSGFSWWRWDHGDLGCQHAWSVDPLATGAWDAGSGAPERQVRPKLRPGKRKSWRSFLWGVSIGSTAMCAGLVALMASGVLTAVSTPEPERWDLSAAAVTPSLALLNWNGAMAVEHPVTSLGADRDQTLTVSGVIGA